MNGPEQIIAEQKAWIASGKIGCVFASALVKMADKIGWIFRVKGQNDFISIKDKAFIVSWIFPGMTVQEVRQWALNYGMYIGYTGQFTKEAGKVEGLRIKMREGISWVQYFGPDSHVVTRQAPYPMLSFTIKLPAHIYAQTMAKGILHLAHASIEHISAKKCNTLWNQSFVKTKQLIGHSPTLREAAKTTFIKE